MAGVMAEARAAARVATNRRFIECSASTVCVALFAVSKQRRKPLLAVSRKIDHAAAGGLVARSPFQLREARHHGGTERAGEMMPPLAPVEAGFADRAARMGEHRGRDLQTVDEEAFAIDGELDVLLLLPHQFLRFHAVEHLHAEIAREMVVADPGPAQR